MDREVAVAKLKALAAGAALARKQLGKRGPRKQGRTTISRKPQSKSSAKKRR
jgi:hypothetical protein